MLYQIGKVTEVNGSSITVALLPYLRHEDGTESGVKEDMYIDLPTHSGPTPVLIGQPGTFVQIRLPSGYLLATVTGIRMTETTPTAAEHRGLSPQEVFGLTVSRTLTTIPVGTFDARGIFERGTDTLPTVGADVYAAPLDKVREAYRSFREANFRFGTLSLIPGEPALIDIDTFLGRHAAVLGQTGGGKSWTLASIIQKLHSFPRANILLLDLHGEYKNAFGSDADYLSASELEIPYWLMNFEELVGICIDRGEREAPDMEGPVNPLPAMWIWVPPDGLDRVWGAAGDRGITTVDHPDIRGLVTA